MRKIFTVPGAPQGKQRPRVTTRGGHPHAFTPAKTALYERSVAEVYQLSFPRQEPLTGAITLILRAYYPIPVSWPKSKKAKALAEMITPEVKPDLDNIIKCVTDGLNGIAYQDDKQIVSIRAEKHYSPMPRVEVELWQE